MVERIPHLFKHNDHGMAIPELADPKFQWVIDGSGWPTYKLVGKLCKVFLQNNEYFCRLYDKAKGTFEVFDPKLDQGLNNAWFNLDEKELRPGYFVAYGKDIRENPHNMSKNEMILVEPINNRLLIASSHGLRPFSKKNVKDIFDILKAEILDEATDCAGVVFHREEQGQLVEVVQVERESFGVGPLKRKPTVMGPSGAVATQVSSAVVPYSASTYEMHKCGGCGMQSCDCVMLQCTGRGCYHCGANVWGV